MHTDSLTIYETTLRVIPTEEGEGAEIRQPMTEPKAVVEQRISHFVMGLGIIGTMTGPLLIVLHTMPTAVFAGVFFSVGFGAIESEKIGSSSGTSPFYLFGSGRSSSLSHFRALGPLPLWPSPRLLLLSVCFHNAALCLFV